MLEILPIPKNDAPVEILLLADPELDKIQKYFDDAVYFAAKNEQRIIGIIALKKIDSASIEIVNLAVEEAWRQRKVGRALLEHALAYGKHNTFKRMTIKTGNSSIAQLALYQKMGFRIRNVQSDYFVHPYQAIIYEHDIQCRDQIELEYIVYSEEEIQKYRQEYWQRFLGNHRQYQESPYEVWSFGYGEYQANCLLALVRQQRKKATSSALEMYDADEKVPQKNALSMIIYGNGLPGCIIKTVEVTHKNFDEITEDEAALEGEGDCSLAYWRTVHEEFFSREYQEKHQRFHPKIPVIFERFEMIYAETS